MNILDEKVLIEIGDLKPLQRVVFAVNALRGKVTVSMTLEGFMAAVDRTSKTKKEMEDEEQ